MIILSVLVLIILFLILIFLDLGHPILGLGLRRSVILKTSWSWVLILALKHFIVLCLVLQSIGLGLDDLSLVTCFVSVSYLGDEYIQKLEESSSDVSGLQLEFLDADINRTVLMVKGK